MDNYATAIGDQNKESNAFSVVATNLGDYYAVGRERNTPTGNNITKLWSNGSFINLTDGTKNAIAASVCIKNTTGNVYVGGNNGPDGKIWKNGVEVYSTVHGYEHAINSVYVFI